MAAVGASRKKRVVPRRTVPHRENADCVEDLSMDYQTVAAAAAESVTI
ncbi:hypothetical protein AB0G20_07625 [Streptomyces sp. NPDC024017]